MDLRFPIVGIQLVTAAAMLILAIISWRRRHTRGASVLVVLCLALMVWAFSSALENSYTELTPALFWAKFKYFGILLVPPTWLIFSLQHTERLNRITPRLIALLSIQPILSLVLIWTTEQHRLFWSDYRIATEQIPAMFDTTRGSLYWAVALYIYVMILYGMWVMVQSAWHSRRLYRAQAVLVTVAVLIPLVANAAFLLNIVKIEGFDPTPVAVGMTCIVIAFGLLRFRLLDLVPIARDMLIEYMSDALLVIDDQKRVVDVNPAMEKLLGGSSGKLLGEPMEILHEQYQELSTIQDGVPFSYAGRIYERKTTLIQGRQGNIQGELYVFHDVSERQKAVDDLNTHVRQLATLQRVDEALTTKLDVDYVLSIALDAAMDVSSADAGGIAIFENGEVRSLHTRGRYVDVFGEGYPKGETGIIGRVIRERQPVYIRDVTIDPDYEPMITETCAQITIPLLWRDLLIGILNIETSQPEHFSDDIFELLKLITVRIAVALDNARLYQLAQQQLSELQTLYDKVRYLEVLKTDMIRIAAHDLRNPIHLVNTYIDLLQDDLKDVLDEQQQQFLGSIKRASAQMLRITNNVLSPEKIERSAETMHMFDLRQLVEETYLAHQDQARQKRINYQIALSDEALQMNGDEVQLGEALANLIVNAIKYTPEGGRVMVSMSRMKSRADIRIEDTGYGVPLDQQEKLFQPFFRAEMDATKNIEGTGLGLHLVKNIVERHFGKVHFQSTEGEGSTFGFEIPVIQG